ncbi:hypothetical protein ACQ4W6_22555 [Janthinobacterium sp. HLX7-2]
MATTFFPSGRRKLAYYAYGTPTRVAGQDAHPKWLSLLFMVEARWQGMDKRAIGFGNFSLADGAKFDPHEGHQSGLDIDVRPLRKDGAEASVSWSDTQYDHDATTKLISLFLEYSIVKVIFFNDKEIPRVIQRIHHDNHFHVTVKG